MRYPEHAEGRLVVRGTLDGEETGFSFPITKEGGTAHRAIDKLFGRAAVGEMMYRWVRGTAAEKGRVRREIVETALAYQLVSRFTSRVAVEEKVERTPDGTRQRVPVRVPLPRGWSSAAFHPTATNDRAWFAAGLVLLLAAGMAQAALRRCREGWARVR
jgi:Ca-activated chloride channel family protein